MKRKVLFFTIMLGIVVCSVGYFYGLQMSPWITAIPVTVTAIFALWSVAIRTEIAVLKMTGDLSNTKTNKVWRILWESVREKSTNGTQGTSNDSCETKKVNMEIARKEIAAQVIQVIANLAGFYTAIGLLFVAVGKSPL